jgi:hypothetical protein
VDAKPRRRIVQHCQWDAAPPPNTTRSAELMAPDPYIQRLCSYRHFIPNPFATSRRHAAAESAQLQVPVRDGRIVFLLPMSSTLKSVRRDKKTPAAQIRASRS